MAKIQILTGSVGGRAVKTANAVAEVLNGQGHQVMVNAEPTPDDLLKDPDETLLVCCSTTGQGALPPNILPVYRALDDETVNLVNRVYGVIALGDSSHKHFANAGIAMEKALSLSGAKRVGDICTLDASKVEDHSLAAVEWAKGWVTKLAS